MEPTKDDLINAFQAEKPWTKEVYEKKIAYLEDENNDLKNNLELIGVRTRKEKLKFVQEREDFLRGLSVFLSDLYTQTAKIQNGLLKNISAINEHLGNLNMERAEETMAFMKEKLNKTKALPNDGMGSNKLSGFNLIHDEEEDDEDNHSDDD